MGVAVHATNAVLLGGYTHTRALVRARTVVDNFVAAELYIISQLLNISETTLDVEIRTLRQHLLKIALTRICRELLPYSDLMLLQFLWLHLLLELAGRVIAANVRLLVYPCATFLQYFVDDGPFFVFDRVGGDAVLAEVIELGVPLRFVGEVEELEVLLYYLGRVFHGWRGAEAEGAASRLGLRGACLVLARFREDHFYLEASVSLVLGNSIRTHKQLVHRAMELLFVLVIVS